jgi:large subunit ribosomal protein L31e
MSQEAERVYTVNLGKVWLSPDNQRAKRAVNMVKEFARHHMKSEQIKIEEDVSHLLWSRSIKHPPRKIRVQMTRTDEGYILVSKYEGKQELEDKEELKKTDEIIKEETKDQIELDTEPKTIAEPEPEPVIESESASKPAAKPAPKPAAKPAPKPAAKPAPKPAAKSEGDDPEFFKQKDKEKKKKPKSKSQD